MEQKQEDRFWIKLIHWISGLAEIGPRIILLALITAEYSYYVSFFIMYRLLHGLMYPQVLSCGKPDSKLEYTLAYLNLIVATVESAPHLTIQIYLLITDTHTVTTQTRKYPQVLSCGKPDSKLEYTLAYLNLIVATVESAPHLTIQIYLLITDTHTVTTQTQNAGMLYLWYSDEPELLHYKIGGAVSNHTWIAIHSCLDTKLPDLNRVEVFHKSPKLFGKQSLKMKRNALLLLTIVSFLCIIDECESFRWPRIPSYPRYPTSSGGPRGYRGSRGSRWSRGRKRATLDNGIQDEYIENEDLEDRHIDERNVDMNEKDDVMNDMDERYVNDIDERYVNDIDDRYVDDSQEDD
ncbi:unnamed protein product [Mytilus coruscus]|uniref:Uncharacterized protein n=1 Tax=Mytilus coruscus TaxID=42192 RepID=A0A6J8D0N4_MYTCO|nr:unnamed protein product [Mytilus coruscus]